MGEFEDLVKSSKGKKSLLFVPRDGSRTITFLADEPAILTMHERDAEFPFLCLVAATKEKKCPFCQEKGGDNPKKFAAWPVFDHSIGRVVVTFWKFTQYSPLEDIVAIKDDHGGRLRGLTVRVDRSTVESQKKSGPHAWTKWRATVAPQEQIPSGTAPFDSAAIKRVFFRNPGTRRPWG